MRRPKTRKIPHRRRRQGKTDFRLRLKLLKSGKPRLVIRKSLNNLVCQVIKYDSRGDRVILSADSRELKKLGWKHHCGNIPSAYLTGLLCGTRAKKGTQVPLRHLEQSESDEMSRATDTLARHDLASSPPDIEKKMAKKEKLQELVLDISLYPSVKGSRLYACLKGVLDSGIKVPHSEEILPPEDRLSGKHIADFAMASGKQSSILKDFETLKAKLLKK